MPLKPVVGIKGCGKTEKQNIFLPAPYPLPTWSLPAPYPVPLYIHGADRGKIGSRQAENRKTEQNEDCAYL